MSKPIIEVQNLSKLYLLGTVGATTIRESAQRWWHKVRGEHHKLRPVGHKHVMIEPDDPQAGPEPNTMWALKDISFSVKQGEIVGIIGKNGAGKSTLLKILSRITEPTSGKAIIRGRVSSLLEVGTGFHPELTGRENIYLNGAILGMRKSEIDCKFNEIVAFAEIEKFIDTPVKHYSSGMYVRLAFAVAAHLEPEILLVDEVLAVGDASFQKKCLGKMGDVARQGRTVLFVSHNMVAVESLCARSIWLDNGQIIKESSTKDVISDYLSNSFSNLTEQHWDNVASAPGNDKVRLRRVCIRPEHGLSTDAIDMQTTFVMEFEYWNLKPQARLNLSLHIYNEQGIMVYNTTSIADTGWENCALSVGLFRSVCKVPGDLMNSGVHRAQLLIVKDQQIVIYEHDDILVFNIHDSAVRRDSYHAKWAGIVHPNLEWHTQHLE